MNYCLYKLSFQAGLHLGGSEQADSLSIALMTCRADTLFSALCITALQLGGEKRLQALHQAAQQGDLLISDCFPFQGESLFLPKPCLPMRAGRQPTEPGPRGLKKKMKGLAWIPLHLYPDYLRYLRGEGAFDPQEAEANFGKNELVDKASMRTQAEDTAPYSLGVFYFHDDCGLYFICGFANAQIRQEMDQLIAMLGLSGLGGKVASGYGSFLSACIDLHHPQAAPGEAALLSMLTDTKATSSLLLSSALPRPEEMAQALDGACYTLLRRGGFVASPSHSSTARKKATQYFLASGSTLVHRFEGDVYDVSPGGAHPVWRYGKAMYMGVSA